MNGRLLFLAIFVAATTSASAAEPLLPIVVLDPAPTRATTAAPATAPAPTAAPTGNRLVRWCHTRVVNTYGRLRNIGGSYEMRMPSAAAVRATDDCVKRGGHGY